MTGETQDAAFRTQRVVLDITVRVGERPLPAKWKFYDLLDIDGINDNLNVVDVTDQPLNEHHVEQMNDTGEPEEEEPEDDPNDKCPECGGDYGYVKNPEIVRTCEDCGTPEKSEDA